MDQVRRRREVETLARPLDDEAERARAGERVENVRGDDDPTASHEERYGFMREDQAYPDVRYRPPRERVQDEQPHAKGHVPHGLHRKDLRHYEDWIKVRGQESSRH